MTNKGELAGRVVEWLKEYETIQRELLEDRLGGVKGALERCESPIEQLMLLAFVDHFYAHRGGGETGTYFVGSFDIPHLDDYGVRIELQKELILRDTKEFPPREQKYRVDFLFTAYGRDYLRNYDETFSEVVVEADGHDFHEKTKEQAERDKSRDRLLTIAGYKVLRFTGREVWRDPEAVALDVYTVLSDSIPPFSENTR